MWLIIEKIGPVRYLIDVGYTVYNRNVDQIEKIGKKLNGDLEKSQLDVILFVINNIKII